MRAFGVVSVVLASSMIALAPENAEAQKRSRDLIKREEIVANMTKDQDLYTTIQRLRPHFFNGSGARSMGGSMTNPVRIYLGNNELPDFLALKNTLAYDVDEVRFLDPSASQNRYGNRANGGAIVIKMDLKLSKKDSTPP